MINEYFEKTDFPLEGRETLRKAVNNLVSCGNAAELIKKARKSLFGPENLEYLSLLSEISEKCGLERMTCDLAFFLINLSEMKKKYEEKGLPEELFWESAADLKYKAVKCRKIYGVWGSFTSGWFKGFFTLKRFKLGRMQYELSTLYRDCEGYGKCGDPVVECHIPASGPLTSESVNDSLRLAYDFYKDEFRDKKVLFSCESWFLYPPHYEVFPKDSNIRKFCDMFDVVHSRADEKNKDFWRIFGMEYSEENLRLAPTDTRLRRNFYEYIISGNKMGEGLGLMLFSPKEQKTTNVLQRK